MCNMLSKVKKEKKIGLVVINKCTLLPTMN